MLRVIALILFLSAQLARADIAIVVHEDNELPSLSKKELLDIFMGRSKSFENKLRADPIDQPLTSQLREQFYTRLTGKSLAQVNAYWAKLKFTGRHQPPRDGFESVNEVLNEVGSNPNAIAYVPAGSELVDGVKIVMVLAE